MKLEMLVTTLGDTKYKAHGCDGEVLCHENPPDSWLTM